MCIFSQSIDCSGGRKNVKFEKRERRLTALVLMALMRVGVCGTASAEEQTGTTFTKGQIDGQGYGFSSSNDFKKYNVWDGATKTYTFTKDSTLNTKSITGNSADVNVNAPDVLPKRYSASAFINKASP